MDFLITLRDWFNENADLLSGIAAAIVVGGFVISPFGAGLRAILNRVRRHQKVVQVETASDSERQSSPLSAEPERPMIAVLPLTNMSDDPQQEYLADGMTEDIITLISKMPAFDVIARNSSFTYKNKTVDVRDVGQDLGAQYVVEGSVRRIGEQLRVTVQLIDAGSGNHIWAEKYDRPVADLFALQDDVTASIAAQILPQLNIAELEKRKKQPTESLNAWSLDRQANMILSVERHTEKNLKRVLELANRAIMLDPSFAHAYGTKTRALSLALTFDETDDRERDFKLAQDSYRKMRELAPHDAETYLTGAQIAQAESDPAKAVTLLEQAIARNPNSVLILSLLGWNLAKVDRVEEGMEKLQRALDLSPHDPARHTTHFLFALSALYGKHYDIAKDHARQATEAFDEYFPAMGLYAGLLLRSGDQEGARLQFQRMQALSPERDLINKDVIITYLSEALHLSEEDAETIGALLDPSLLQATSPTPLPAMENANEP